MKNLVILISILIGSSAYSSEKFQTVCSDATQKISVKYNLNDKSEYTDINIQIGDEVIDSIESKDLLEFGLIDIWSEEINDRMLKYMSYSSSVKMFNLLTRKMRKESFGEWAPLSIHVMCRKSL